MKKIIYGLVVLVLCFVVNNTSAQVAQIGYGTQAPLTNGAIYSPICKFSGTGNPFSRSNVLYTSSELNTEGITAGAIISKLSFYKIGTGASTSPSSLKIYLRNSTTTAPLTVGTLWTSIVASHTLCYSNTSQTISSATGWVEFILDNPFTYTGQNLEIAFDSDFTGSGSSGSFDWQYTPGFSDYILGYVSSSAGTGLTGTVVNYKQRANIKISYTPGSPCTVPPVSGNVTSSKLNACIGEAFTLNLSGNSAGSGQTYKWQQSVTGNAPWSDVDTAKSSPSQSTSQLVSTYYRCAVTCGGNTVYSDSLQVLSPLAINGSFTINSALPTGSGNFQNFADAADYIKCGIGGPVVFDVAVGSGPYTEQVIFTSVYGTSATNTVTINGNGETLTFSGGTATNPNTLSLNGADYFRINYLNIEATGATYAIAAHLYNAADNNKFSNCTFTSSITGTATTQAAFVISGAAGTVATAGLSGSGNIVDSCTMVGGYYSTVVYGSTAAPFVENNQILNSSAKDFYSYGIYNVYGRNTIIRHNIVERVNRTNPTTAYGIYLSTSSYNCTVDGNRVRKLFEGNTASTSAAYCLYNAGSGAAGFENKWINNLVSDINSKGTIYGMYCPTYNFVKIYHNTISLDDATATGALATNGIYAYGNPVDIKNNIVTISRGGTGTKYCLYLSTSTTTTSDNNVLFMNASAGTANYTAYRTSAYATLAAWQTATSLDMNSFSVDPFYSSPSTDDYAPTETSIDNKGASLGVLRDILDTIRPLILPDMGAYEFGTLPSSCSATPAPGNTVSSVPTACPNGNFTLSLEFPPSELGLTFQWQSADDAAFTTNVVSLGTASTQTTSQTAAKYYRCKVTCTNSGLFTYSDVVFVDINTWINCYCTPATTGGTTYYISGFTTTGGSTNINKTTSAGSASGYQDFFATDEVTINRGDVLAYTINVAGGSNYGFALWIDFNQDGIFQATEQVLTTSTYEYPPKTGTVAIPNTAVLGTTRMRVLASYTPNNPSDPCTNSGTGEYQDYAITFTQATCTTPGSITVNSITTNTASVNFNAGGGTAFIVEYGAPGFTPGTDNTAGGGTIVLGASSPIALSSLTANTMYDVYVRQDCSAGGNGYSNNSMKVSFTTACDAATIPYTEDFNSTTGVALPNCTSAENVGVGNNWATAASPGAYGFSSRVLQYTYNVSNAANAWFYTAALNLTGGTTYTLSYKYGNNSTSYVEKVNVYYGTNPANASMTEFLADHPSINTANAATNTVDFTPATTGVYYIGFHVYSIANQYYLYVDDINVIEKVLPVTYTSFTGKKEGSVNLLSWQTATEINNTGFELQRSADNKNFSKLNFIASKANNGNSNAMLSYNYTDAKPLASSNYYRLKQIDRDGKANYSNTILLKGDNVKQVSIVGAYPNPTRNILNVQIVAPAQERVSLVVTDITGKILQQETMVLNTGDNTKQIDVSRLTQGTYIIKTICSNGCESAVFKFTKN